MGFFFFTIKLTLKKQKSFDRSAIIFKLKDRIFSCAHIISCKNANEVLTKKLKYLHKNNTGNCGKNDKKRCPIKRLIFFHGLFAIGWLVLYLREYYDVLRNLTCMHEFKIPT